MEYNKGEKQPICGTPDGTQTSDIIDLNTIRASREVPFYLSKRLSIDAISRLYAT